MSLILLQVQDAQVLAFQPAGFSNYIAVPIIPNGILSPVPAVNQEYIV
jgi:hypothetical protein